MVMAFNAAPQSLYNTQSEKKNAKTWIQGQKSELMSSKFVRYEEGMMPAMYDSWRIPPPNQVAFFRHEIVNTSSKFSI